MAQTQMQLIQSLGEALAWLERELSWEVPATELRHLCGRIGELYACVVTNGQMANKVNQNGYDVRSSSGERVSVKTTAVAQGGQVLFNEATLNQVDRIMVLRINTEEMQVETLLDEPLEEARVFMKPSSNGKLAISVPYLVARRKPLTSVHDFLIREVEALGYSVQEFESGTIKVCEGDDILSPTKPELRKLALKLGVPLLNSNGNPYNTRQLGGLVMNAMEAGLDSGEIPDGKVFTQVRSG